MARSETFYLDNSDGNIDLFRRDRTDGNHLADNKGDAVGKLTAMLINEVDRLPKYDSLQITITKINFDDAGI